MGQTFAEKIFSKMAGRPVVPGTILTIRPDFVLTHDNSSAIFSTFKKMGGKKVNDPDQILIILDHIVPANDEKAATNHKTVRQFVKDQGVKNFYDGGRGICHQVVLEEGFALPGKFLVGSDSHTTTYGVMGAFSTGIGRSESAGIWATGTIWLKVPESMKIVLKGKPKPFVSSKDVLLHIAKLIKVDGALYKSVEFSGDYIDSIEIADRIIFTNMSVEIGAKNGYIAPDKKVFDYLEKRGFKKDSYQAIYSDPDAEYAETLEIDVSKIDPVAAAPHSVDNVKDVSEFGNVKVDQVLIGTCTNGRIEDFRVAAGILKGKKINKDTRLLILPASSEIYIQAMEEGLFKIFIEAGGMILNPGCGPCLGAHEGIMAPGEVTVSTANRNFKGRMGCNQSDIYLVSPAVAAATAIKGFLTVPESK
jgi:homoaconitate hydratase family protein